MELISPPIHSTQIIIRWPFACKSNHNSMEGICWRTLKCVSKSNYGGQCCKVPSCSFAYSKICPSPRDSLHPSPHPLLLYSLWHYNSRGSITHRHWAFDGWRQSRVVQKVNYPREEELFRQKAFRSSSSVPSFVLRLISIISVWRFNQRDQLLHFYSCTSSSEVSQGQWSELFRWQGVMGNYLFLGDVFIAWKRV